MDRTESGFTLIELLVVVAIIGILASIAIVQFSEYRERSFNARAMSDLRNTISAQEALFVDNETYQSDITQLPGFDASSPAVTLILAANGASWRGSSYHPRGNTTYCYDSSSSNGILELDGVNQTCP